jgi:hypothetical protein
MEKFARPSPLGYDHSLPIYRMEAVARESASARSVSNPHNKPKVRPRKVGHHAAVRRPRRFCVQLDKDYLYMLVIPNKLRPYVKGRPYPQLVSLKNNKDCEWVVHANRFKDDVVLDNGWQALAAFYNLKVGDYMMCKIAIEGFNMKVCDPISYDQKVVIYREHADLE